MTEVVQGEQPSPLDQAQEFAAASSYQVRDELVKLIERALLGPWDGELEVLPPRSAGPGERYLVGRLGPRHDPQSGTDAAGGAVDTEIAAGGDGADGELPDLLTMQNAGRMWASSMGLSCVVASGVDTLTVTASWGRYGKAEVLDEAGNPRRSWSREAARYVKHVRFGDGPSQRIPLTMPDARLSGVYLAVDIRPRANGSDAGAHVVELGLVNAQDEPAVNKDAAWLFQPELAVTAAVEQELAVFCPIDDPLEDFAALDRDTEDRQLRLLYRDELRHAVGRNIAVHAHVRAGERHAYRLETTWLPTYEVPATIAPPAEPGSYLAEAELSMDELATVAPGRLAAGLGPLAAGDEAWLDEEPTPGTGLAEAPRGTGGGGIWMSWPRWRPAGSRQDSGRWRPGMRHGLTSSRPGSRACLRRCGRRRRRPSSPRCSAPAGSGPGSSSSLRLPLPGTRWRWKRSGLPTRRWHCSGGTPPSPRCGKPAG